MTNADHFAPDYAAFLADGVGGTLKKIGRSLKTHEHDADFHKKQVFLRAAEIAMRAFGDMIRQYAAAAEAKAEQAVGEKQKANLLKIAAICEKLAAEKPESFHEALQLIWLVHTAFLYEDRYAMALGRLDQTLYPFYKKDIENGALTRAEALELMECMLVKIGERRYFGGDDVVNIAIGGVTREGEAAVNELSYVILEAVKNANIPGPNLSARIYDGIPDEFLDECLKVIGTGLGYPALMNDGINIPALARHGYALEDCRDYCIGCIENLFRKQWSDGRFNVPKYMNSRSTTAVAYGFGRAGTGRRGIHDDGRPRRGQEQIRRASEYMMLFRNQNERFHPVMFTQPFRPVWRTASAGASISTTAAPFTPRTARPHGHRDGRRFLPRSKRLCSTGNSPACRLRTRRR